MKLRELSDRIGAELVGDGDVEISGARGIKEAGEGEITFLADERRASELDACRASAAIVPPGVKTSGMALLRMKNPRLGFAIALQALYVKPYEPRGISERAVIGRGVSIGSEPSIYPNVFIDDGARLGARVTLYPGVYIGRGSILGDDCILYPNVCVREGVVIGSRVIIHAGSVIGSDGFGFVTDAGRHHKIPQVGGVVIEDDVEIGANCTIDRATLGNTIIKKGTKLDNLVHIAHNVSVGEHCLFAAQVGVAGSTTIGNYVVLGGQVGVGDHVTISDHVMAAGQTAIIKDPGKGAVVGGTYAMPQREWLKVQAVLPKLPELKRLIMELMKQIKKLEEKP